MYKGDSESYVNNTGWTCFWEVFEEATYDAKLVQRRSTADRSGKKCSPLFYLSVNAMRLITKTNRLMVIREIITVFFL